MDNEYPEANDLNDQALIDFSNSSEENYVSSWIVAKKKYQLIMNQPGFMDILANAGEILAVQLAMKDNEYDINSLIKSAMDGNQPATLRYLEELKSVPVKKAIDYNMMREITKYSPELYRAVRLSSPEMNKNLSDMNDDLRRKNRIYTRDDIIKLYGFNPYSNMNKLPHKDNEIWGILHKYNNRNDRYYILFTDDQFKAKFGTKQLTRRSKDSSEGDVTFWSFFPIRNQDQYEFKDRKKVEELLGVKVNQIK